jgi:hypothetical protein
MITKKQHTANLKENRAIATRLAGILIKDKDDDYFRVSFERIGNGHLHFRNFYDCHVANVTLSYPEPYNRVKIKVHSSSSISVWHNPEVEDNYNQVFQSENFSNEQEAKEWLESKDCPILGYQPIFDD